MKYLDQLDVKGKKVLVRGDYNVPLKDGKVEDDTRLRESIPTLKYVLDGGGALILCSHLGKAKGFDPALSMKPVAARLQQMLGVNIEVAPDCVGAEVEKAASQLKPGQILMLENLRFNPGESKNNEEFGRQLASLADIYVDDAFGVAHRAHASVVSAVLQAKVACAGHLLKKEWLYLGEKLADPARPFIAVSGGSKVSTKLGILKNLLNKVDGMIIGGAMANTFIKALGFPVGTSLVEDDLLAQAIEIMEEAKAKKVAFYLPVDLVVGEGPKAEKPSGIHAWQNLPEGLMALDVGPATTLLFSEAVATAKTVVWNGPVGAFENPAFAGGSIALAKAIASLDAVTIVGGGDTDSLVHKSGEADKFSFISTGGGSFMEFLEGKEMPAFKALMERDAK